MSYNPQDPTNFAFYQTYLDKDKRPTQGGGSGCLRAAIFLLLSAVVIAAALMR